MIDQDMRIFFAPTSVLIYGASRSKTKSGHYALKNMIKYSPESLFIIHPKADEILGVKCYRDVQTLPHKEGEFIDLAIISLPVQFVTEAVLACIEIGVRGILIQSGDIALSDEKVESDWRVIQGALDEKEDKFGKRTRIMGPNSLGIFNNQDNFFTGIMDFDVSPPFCNDNLAIVAQTGLVVSGYLMDLFESQDVGISHILAIGNKLDVDECDVLRYLIKDEHTKTVAFYLEGIKDGRCFCKLCEEAIHECDKKILLLNSGKSELGKMAIASHTNSLAADDNLLKGICNQLGIIQVDNFAELMLTGKLATHLHLPRGRRIGLISISGAGCVLSADFADKYGFTVPRLPNELVESLSPIFPEWEEINHPVDMWGSIERYGPKTYDQVIEKFLGSGLFDLIIFCSIAGRRALLDYKNLRSLLHNHPDIPVILQIFGGFNELKKNLSEEFERPNKHDAYLPVVYDLERVMKLLSKLVDLKMLKDRKSAV